MNIYVNKGRREGRISVPASKSVAHRMLILAALCEGKTSIIHGITPSEDVLATIECLSDFGVQIEYDGECAKVSGIDFSKAEPKKEINCRESGSTLRFLIPLAMLSGKEVTFVGTERLISRPQDIYEKIAEDEGLVFKRDNDRIIVCGPLRAGEYFIDGSVSSQFITGLLIAFSTMSGDSKIIFNTPIESRPYVDLTISLLKEFGIRVYYDTDWSFFIFGGQDYKSNNLSVEGDWSAAAFFEALNHLGGSVTLDNLNQKSLQGDSVCNDLFTRLGDGFCEINIENCPDLGPILFVMAAVKHGAKIIGTRRLRFKESDRISSMKTELEKFGADISVEENSVTIKKTELHAPKKALFGHNDHRIVMALAIICSLYGGEIKGAEAVKKSYPDFFTDLESLLN